MISGASAIAPERGAEPSRDSAPHPEPGCLTCDDHGYVVPYGSDIRIPCPDCVAGYDY